MFGLENKPKKPSQEFHFDLEKDLKDSKKHKALKAKIEAKIQDIKNLLRGGKIKRTSRD